MVATTPQKMTVEEFLKLPEDGVRRSLINGIVKEYGMTVRAHLHATVLIEIAFYLRLWLESQPLPRGRFSGGEAGVRLTEDTTVGVDLAYYSAELLARQTGSSTMIVGVPSLVVEILSPSDTLAETEDKVDTYLSAGVPITWIVNPRRQTVTVYRPHQRSLTFNADQELTAEPVLPGFRIAVADLFR